MTPSSTWKEFRRQTQPGAAPGSIVVDPESPRPVIRTMVYGAGQFQERDIAAPQLLEPLIGEGAVIWVDIDGLGDAQIIREIGEVFGLHHLALEDVVNDHQRAKVEDYTDFVFVVARMISRNGEFESEQVSFFLGRNFVLTFQQWPGDTFDPVRERLRNNSGRIRTASADYLLYALLDSVIDGYFPVLEQIGNALDEIDSRDVHELDQSSMSALRVLRSDLLQLRRAVWPLRDAMSNLLRDDHTLISQDTRLYLRDCYDHTVQILDVTETYRELCADLRDYYFSALGQRTNDIMKVLTIIATIFIPLSFVASLYGMNFDTSSPWNMPELEWHYGYPYALTVMAVMAGLLIFFIRRKRWL